MSKKKSIRRHSLLSVMQEAKKLTKQDAEAHGESKKQLCKEIKQLKEK